MPIIVACPSCAGQLRVADDLIGRKVRCPACSTTFDAQPASPGQPARPPANDAPTPTEKVDGWKFLSLELSDDPAPKSPVGPKKTIDLDSNESIPIPPTPLDSPPQLSNPRPSLRDDHDDVAPCPSCGRLVHRDLKRCTHCGERFSGPDEDDEDRPRRRRIERRDTEPHRGGFILAMGIVSLALLTMCPWLSIIPGLIAWICGQGDLRKMRENTMDPDGEGTTQAGWICGMIGTGLGGLVILLCSGWMGFIFYMENQRSRNMTRPPFVAPVPPPKAPVLAPGQNR